MRAVALAVWLSALALSTVLAPFQCASTPDPDRRPEDTPSEALISLAEQFGREGDPDARRATLRYLIERYPDSREAERARVWLAREGDPQGAP